MKRKTQSYTLEEATKKLEYYCAYQDRCHKDVTTKLREMRMIPDAIDIIVGHLIQENYLNEERFAKSFARGKFKIKKWGRIRITNELKLRNINAYLIKVALKELDENDYMATFNTLAVKRLESIKEKNVQKKKKKLGDYLLYRGWESHLVYGKIHELIK